MQATDGITKFKTKEAREIYTPHPMIEA